ncbi:MAG: transglycosylase SLT domain-containing protein [Pseudomonadota bacterium]
MIARSASRLITTLALLALTHAVTGVALTPVAQAESDATNLNAQRAAFTRHWDAVVDGQWPLPKADKKLLQHYPLWPDLVAAHLSHRIEEGQPDRAERKRIEAFMAQTPSLAPVGRLRYRYTKRLAQTGDWAAFGLWYDRHYAGERDSALGCSALAAAVRGDLAWDSTRVANAAARLWLTAASQDATCDQPFDVLRRRSVIDAALIRQRYEMTIEAREWSRARYLARLLGDPRAQAAVAAWRRAAADPGTVLSDTTEHEGARLAYAARRLAVRAPARAHALWQTRRSTVTPDHRDTTDRYIALASAQDRLPQASAWLAALPTDQQDLRILEWRARAALAENDWPEVLRAIGRMPMAEAASDRWRYWESVALIASGQADAGRGLLTALASERSYHGFRAADRLGLEYQFGHTPLAPAAAALTALAEDPALLRVRELQAVGQSRRARAELARWRRGKTTADPVALAALLHQWGWHVEAITAAAGAGEFDDLDLRFPLAYDQEIAAAARTAGISADWVRGIARTESAFDPAARSSANAYGLMQLLPATGRRMARKTRTPWQGTESLLRPEVNIALGTVYLEELEARFGHRVLATAAYNAGENRAERWRTEASDQPVEIWIETVPYDETRRYIERVFFASVVFTWRRGAPMVRLATRLAPNQSSHNTDSRLYSTVASAIPGD